MLSASGATVTFPPKDEFSRSRPSTVPKACLPAVIPLWLPSMRPVDIYAALERVSPQQALRGDASPANSRAIDSLCLSPSDGATHVKVQFHGLQTPKVA